MKYKKELKKVKCIRGTSRHRIPGGALNYWKRETGNLFNLDLKCGVFLCSKLATDGAHVILATSENKKQYIVPMCHEHNEQEGEPFIVYSELVPVVPEK